MNAPVNSPEHLSSPALEFSVVPLLHLEPHAVQFYFQRLYVADTLKYRFSDIVDPTWSDALEVIQRMGQQMYLVVNEDQDILGEFMFENFTGKSCQSHFSTSPDTDTKTRIKIGRFAAEYSLTRRHPETDEYFLDSLFGLTPLINRAACIFALKIGYKKQGILPSGMMVDGKPEDCMISVCTRSSFDGS